ncbi:hypothetical protein BgramDRAFT_1184 [Paraburkholderia graminis C4D1M]|uniref:Uncharacterized protein n=1 Tax=Paraburkholderia graminis (strain ATCC 700544 / DSM 17151 / LMG 18924 / NCIMB 13744 / C4D1M) TaxID=396598 RepID=B1FVN9_PARG4|nr:hypothetical protein BgramDRAFT_1184 [Paraburkholderia graminis C4D1M]
MDAASCAFTRAMNTGATSADFAYQQTAAGPVKRSPIAAAASPPSATLPNSADASFQSAGTLVHAAALAGNARHKSALCHCCGSLPGSINAEVRQLAAALPFGEKSKRNASMPEKNA